MKKLIRNPLQPRLFSTMCLAAVGAACLAVAQMTPALAQKEHQQEFRAGNLIESGNFGDPKGWKLDGFAVAPGLWIHRHSQPGPQGTATTTFLGPDGFYKIRVKYWDEGDGVSRAWITVGERPVGAWQFDGILVDSARWKEFDGVEIKKGEQIALSGSTGGYEYCRIFGMEILPSKPLPPTPPAAAIEPTKYSMNLVPVSGRPGVPGEPNYIIAPTRHYRGAGGTHWIYLRENQEFVLTAVPGYAGAESKLEYSLTKVGADKPLKQETLESGDYQPLVLRLRAEGEGLYELKILTRDAWVDYDVPGVKGISDIEGYFFVPKGTKAFSLRTSSHTILMDAAGNVVLDQYFDNAALPVINVPEGSDNQVWSFEGPVREFVGIPNYMSERHSTMLAPAEVLQ